MISSKLVLTLLTAISGYTGYAIPGAPPNITALPHDVLAQRVCGRPCRVLGFTLPNGDIVIDEALAIGRDSVATSILVHELTHYLQIKSVAHPGPVTCQIWQDREREAFDVQARWLRETSATVRVFSVEMARLNFSGINTLCADHSSVAPHQSWTKGCWRGSRLLWQAGNAVLRIILVGDADTFDFNNRYGLGELTMKVWKTPRLREICVGMEINSYACARL